MFSMSNAKKNILLVGGSGYLGNHLRNVISNYNLFFTSTTGRENSIQLDFSDTKTFDNIKTQSNYDCIFILASSLLGLGTTELKNEYIQLDTLGLSNFLQFVNENKLTEKIIYTSSMTVYGTDNVLPVKEDGVLNPLSTYGLSKVLGETILKFHCQSTTTKGVVLRIPGIYGGNRTSGFIYNTAQKCKKNESIAIDSSSLGYWETIHINDLSVSINEFIQNYDWKNNFNIFNISYGTKTDFIDCASIIKETLNSTSEIIHKGNKGYVDFYLDNSKVKQYVTINDNYISSLKSYLKSI